MTNILVQQAEKTVFWILLLDTVCQGLKQAISSKYDVIASNKYKYLDQNILIVTDHAVRTCHPYSALRPYMRYQCIICIAIPRAAVSVRGG